MKLRPYQSEALDASLKRWQAGVNRQAVVLPTGTGKAVLLAMMPQHHGFDKRTLVLVHRIELADQALDKIKRWNPGINCGIEMGDRHAAFYDQIVVASVPTLSRTGSRRIGKFSPDDFDCVITDECHHATSASYLSIYEHFGVRRSEGCERLHVGFTATPNRGDGAPLSEVLDEIVYQLPLRQCIEEGWLSDIRAVQVRSKTNLDDVHVSRGDFKTGELERAVNNDQRNGLILSAWRQYASLRKTLLFAVDVAHAQELAEIFRGEGVACQAVWGEDPARNRKIAAYRAGELQMLCLCQIGTEGFDDPMTDCVLLARPTQSKLLFTQMCGRATRLEPGVDNRVEAVREGRALLKPDALILDVVDVTSRHSLAGVGSLVGMGDQLDFAGESVVKWAKRFEDALEEKPQLDTSRIKSVIDLEVAMTAVDMFRDAAPPEIASFARMSWNQYSDGSFLVSLPGRGSAHVSRNVLGQWEAKVSLPEADPKKFSDEHRFEQHRRAVEVVRSVSVPPQFHSVEDAIGWTERLLGRAGFSELLSQNSEWRRLAPSQGQIDFARKLRLHVPKGATRGELSRAIDAALAQRRARRGR